MISVILNKIGDIRDTGDTGDPCDISDIFYICENLIGYLFGLETLFSW